MSKDVYKYLCCADISAIPVEIHDISDFEIRTQKVCFICEGDGKEKKVHVACHAQFIQYWEYYHG